jgi:beta-phosphoglucomutase
MAWQQILGEIGIEIEHLYIELHEGEKAETTVLRLLQQHDQDHSTERVNALIEKKRALYQSNAPRGLNNDARNLVDALRQRGLKCHIVTGSNLRNLEKTISTEEFGLFETVTAADDYHFGKPDPEPYLTGIARGKCRSEEALVLENAPLGVRAAKAAGIRTIAITTTLPQDYLSEADHIIHHYEELLSYV